MIALDREAVDISTNWSTSAKRISTICSRLGSNQSPPAELLEVAAISAGYQLVTIMGDPSLERRSLVGTLEDAIPDHDQSFLNLMDSAGKAFAPKQESLSVPCSKISALTHASRHPYRKAHLGRFLLLVVILVLSACATPHYAGRGAAPPYPCKSYRCIGQGPR